jgi:hypothetical protein
MATSRTAAGRKTTKATSSTPAKKAVAGTPAKKASASKAAATAKSTPKKTAKKTTVSSEERYQMIATAAYFLAERRGFSGCYEMVDWITAEAEIDAKLKA